VHFVVIMDPVESVLEDQDTSFALMLAAQERGHRVDHCLQRALYLDRGKLYARARPAHMERGRGKPITLGESEDVCLHDVDAVLVRTDPPFDSDYLWTTLLLDRVKADTLVVNDPHGLRQANEKLYALYFPELMPRTLVSADKERIRGFVEHVGGRAVLKPLDGAGGEGVMALTTGDMNFNAIIEATTRNGRRLAMAQEFLPAVRTGDKRVLLLDGQPLGAILRVPKQDDMRSNIHVGGSVVRAELDADDRRIIATLAPRLRQDGLHFVGLDVIGGKLTEVNVTSPTGIQQMTRLDGQNYSDQVVVWIEARVAGHAGSA
jgi:glutathione synthase